jgi:pre-mRNA-processing factor 6
MDSNYDHIIIPQDLWLEAIRLHPPDVAKGLMKEALEANVRFEKLWIKSAELETLDEDKREVYAKAREAIPKSALIWKKSIALTPPEQVLTLLRQAVEYLPDAVEFSRALSVLLPCEEADQVLGEATGKNPNDLRTWIAAAGLQEQEDELDLASKIIECSVWYFTKKGVEITRNDWLKEAVDAEKSHLKHTCHEIIRRIISWNVPEQDWLSTWLEDVKSFISSNSINCARSVYTTIVEDKNYSRMESVWLDYANFELKHGNADSLMKVLKQAVEPQHCNKSESLWLMLASRTRSLLKKRSILMRALNANPNSENILLAGVELDIEIGNFAYARQVLTDAYEANPYNEKFVLAAVRLEKEDRNLTHARRILANARIVNPNNEKILLSAVELEIETGNLARAKQMLVNARDAIPNSVMIVIVLAAIEFKMQNGDSSDIGQILSDARMSVKSAQLVTRILFKPWTKPSRVLFKPWTKPESQDEMRRRLKRAQRKFLR